MSYQELIKAVNALVESPPSPETVAPEERLALLASLDKLRNAVETPLDATTRIVFGPYEQVALRLGVDMGIFTTMATVLPAGEMEVQELAKRIKADELLVSRIMRLLSAMTFFTEVAENKYANGRLAPAFADGSPFPHVVLHITTGVEALVRLPEFLKKTNYKNPDKAKDGIWQLAKGTDLHYFDWLKTDPAQALAFNTVMTIQRMDTGDPWFDYYPVEEKFGKRTDNKTPLLVDIGGGIGHDLAAFHNKFPSLEGRLVLEELPEVIDEIKDLDSSIERVKHDFFTPQPEIAKGAKAYYLSTVLHDWPDKEAKEILAGVRSAMTEDSILLINENALPNTNVPLFPAKLDIWMMVAFSATDRTVKQFETLIDESGFELVKIHRPDVVVARTGYLFEAVLKK